MYNKIIHLSLYAAVTTAKLQNLFLHYANITITTSGHLQ